MKDMEDARQSNHIRRMNFMEAQARQLAHTQTSLLQSVAPFYSI